MYTTPPGVCAVGDHPITDAPQTDNGGFRSPRVPEHEAYLSGGSTPQSNRVLVERLCLSHYQEAFREVYAEQIEFGETVVPFTEEALERDRATAVAQTEALLARLKS